MDIERLTARRTIELTIYGRKTGLPRRIEIWWFHVGGRFVITGTPGRRDWLANVIANPAVVVHVDGADIEATARVVEEADLRRTVFTQPPTRWYSTQAELDHLVETTPMIELDLRFSGGRGLTMVRNVAVALRLGESPRTLARW